MTAGWTKEKVVRVNLFQTTPFNAILSLIVRIFLYKFIELLFAAKRKHHPVWFRATVLLIFRLIESLCAKILLLLTEFKCILRSGAYSLLIRPNSLQILLPWSFTGGNIIDLSIILSILSVIFYLFLFLAKLQFFPFFPILF